ncbi:hypothetical protein R4172_18970 [Rhodococcus kroppenstedtii]|uniref:hypothetical protein n=1 Tax=Rhodococcoides kroppenstedtii TaxID=293050 RepID=UPI002955B515|nr:hypothetical protein [Rhodococcus kroppenstedtii]MDV7199629.1 hypothetical protein [Rhodococcus kroppenstedtii]
MAALALRIPRVRVVFTVAFLLAHLVGQCGIVLAHGHDGTEVHVSSSSSPPVDEFAPDHAHIDDSPTHLLHDAHAVVAMPRQDNPFRSVTGATVLAAVLTVVLIALSAQRPPRAPPSLPVPVRGGRTVLNEHCINRC